MQISAIRGRSGLFRVLHLHATGNHRTVCLVRAGGRLAGSSSAALRASLLDRPHPRTATDGSCHGAASAWRQWLTSMRLQVAIRSRADRKPRQNRAEVVRDRSSSGARRRGVAHCSHRLGCNAPVPGRIAGSASALGAGTACDSALESADHDQSAAAHAVMRVDEPRAAATMATMGPVALTPGTDRRPMAHGSMPLRIATSSL